MRRARLIGYPPTHAARPRAIFQEVRYASLAVIPLYAYAVVGSASEALSAALDPGAGRFAITIKNDPHIIQLDPLALIGRPSTWATRACAN